MPTISKANATFSLLIAKKAPGTCQEKQVAGQGMA
jgi:hypothetical protein